MNAAAYLWNPKVVACALAALALTLVSTWSFVESTATVRPAFSSVLAELAADSQRAPRRLARVL